MSTQQPQNLPASGRGGERFLELRDVSKAYGHGKTRHQAVHEVSLDLHAGTALGIVGESGSGKSTVARMIIGLETPDSGTIRFSGEELPTTRSKLQRLQRAKLAQMVFQDPYQSLDPRTSAWDSLAALLRLHGMTSAVQREERIAELLQQVGLTKRQGSALPRDLSGGQRQRVAIAQVLAISPRLMILDEAVSALDVSVQAQVLNLVADIKAQTDLTVLFISHDLAVIRYVCDDVVVMRSGEIVERGATSEVLTKPQSDYTKTLLDSVPRASRRWTT